MTAGPPTRRTGPRQEGPSSVEITTTDTASVAQDDFAAGYLLGYESGYDVGVAAAEAEMAEAWMAEVHRIRALGRPDDYMARVRAAEKHVRSVALRQWSDRDAWDSAKQAAPGFAVAIDRLRGGR